jgi:hypothetical protein
MQQNYSPSARECSSLVRAFSHSLHCSRMASAARLSSTADRVVSVVILDSLLAE